MIIKINLTKEEQLIAEQYSKLKGIKLNKHMKEIFFEKVDDEIYDLLKEDGTYTVAEVKKELDI